MAQLNLPGFPVAPTRPARRCLWAAEIARLAQVTSSQRAADRRHQAEVEARLAGALADVRYRLTAVEHATGVADLGSVPPPGRRLSAYRGR
jgi:hypothetical protein